MHPQFIESSVTFVVAAMMLAHTLARGDRSHATRAVVSLMLALMIWTGCVALSRVDADATRAPFFQAAALVGGFLTPPIWLWLAASFTRPARVARLGRWGLLIFAPTLAVCLLLATNSHHRLVIGNWDVLMTGSGKDWAGPAFWPWIFWAYALVIAGSGLYMAEAMQFFRGRIPTRGAVLVSAAVVPLASTISFTFGFTEGQYDRTPLFLGCSVVLLYVADWRYRLLDTMPIARRDVIDELQDGVVVADVDGLIVHMNEAAEEMTEVKMADVLGQSLVDVVMAHSGGKAKIDEAWLRDAVRNLCSGSAGVEARLETYKGRIFEIRGASVGGEDDGVTGFYMILRDRTAAARYESVLQQSRRSEAIASLAGGIAHEVNNPLAYVRANVSHLMSAMSKLADAPDAEVVAGLPEMHDVLEETLEGVDRIGNIVDQVLRLSTREPSIERLVDINMVIEDAIRIRGIESDPRICLETTLAEALPPVTGSKDRLLRCVIEVLENAERIVAGRDGRISIATRETHGNIVIGIGDDGPGIDLEFRDRVFDPFFTAGSTDAGSGLGLALAAKVASDAGGGMEIVESKWGGAEVVIRLPARYG